MDSVLGLVRIMRAVSSQHFILLSVSLSYLYISFTLFIKHLGSDHCPVCTNSLISTRLSFAASLYFENPCASLFYQTRILKAAHAPAHYQGSITLACYAIFTIHYHPEEEIALKRCSPPLQAMLKMKTSWSMKRSSHLLLKKKTVTVIPKKKIQSSMVRLAI